MEISPTAIRALQLGSPGIERLQTAPTRPALENAEPSEMREKFQQFVAGTFFRTLLDAMRNTVEQGSLMHGGRAEEIFRAQLDQTLVDKMADSHGGGIADEMFQQFQQMMNWRPRKVEPIA